MSEIKLGYEDVSVIPDIVTTINHRADCWCYDETFTLPIFTAPMDNVVDDMCMEQFHNNCIHTVLPRTIPYYKRVALLSNSKEKKTVYSFVSFSLEETRKLFTNEIKPYDGNDIEYLFREKIKELVDSRICLCIDLASGHMSSLLKTIKQIKDTYGDKVLVMSGNIANPKTYAEYEAAGCDYVRCSIGSGSCCTTASNTGIYFPIFSLIKEVWEVKQAINGKCKIIADGGIKGFRDVQKALVYADYAMIGGLFNKAIDSAGTPVYGRSYWTFWGERILNPIKTLFTYGRPVKPKHYEKVLRQIQAGKVEVWKGMYGMSTEEAQAKMNPDAAIKVSEGIAIKQKVEFSIKQWSEKEKHYLRSAMSYTNSRTLDEYKDSNWVRKTHRAHND